MTTYTCPAGHTSSADDYCDVCGAPIGTAGAGGAGSATSARTGSAAAAPGAGAGGASVLDLGGPGSAGAGAAPGARTCPHCGAENLPTALFCEDCGYDFTTGQAPRDLPGAGAAPGSASGASGTAPAVDPATLTLPATSAGVGQPAAASAPTAPPPLPTAGPVEWVAEVWIDPDWYAAQDAADPCPSPGMPLTVPLRERSVLIGRRSVSRGITPQIDCGVDTGVSRRHAQLTTDGQRWWVEDLQSANGTFLGAPAQPLPTTAIPPGQRTEVPDDARIYVGAWTRIVVRPATDAERAAG